VLSVIQAVFIQQTMRSAQHDEDLMMLMKARDKHKNVEKLKGLFRRMDPDGDGFVSREAFVALLDNQRVKLFMSAFEIDVNDAEALAKVLDDGEGMISMEDFISGLMSLRGSAKAIDMVAMLNITRRMEAKMDAHIMSMDTQTPMRNYHRHASRRTQGCFGAPKVSATEFGTRSSMG